MIKKGLIAGLVNFIFGLILTWVLGMIFPSVMQEYQNTSLFRPWNDPLMMIYFAYPFILGIVSAYFWDLLKSNLKGKNLNKSFQFAKIYFIVATIPGMFVSYTCFQISFTMVLIWTVTGFLQMFIAGYIFTKLK